MIKVGGHMDGRRAARPVRLPKGDPGDVVGSIGTLVLEFDRPPTCCTIVINQMQWKKIKVKGT
jgi:hypothetical protein